MLGYYAEFEAQMLAELWSKPDRNVTSLKSNGTTFLAFRLPDSGKTEENTTIFVESLGASVIVPPSLLGVEKAAVLTVSDEGALAMLGQGTDNEGRPVDVKGAVNMKIYNRTGGVTRVTGLDPPIVIRMPPFNGSENAVCAYFHVDTKSWAYDGLTTRHDDVVECLTTHLTFFAAIIRGILAALMCSQLTLLNGEALKELAKPGWIATPLGIAFIGLLLAYAGLFAAAAVLDKRRKASWSDECFLYASRLRPAHFESSASSQSVGRKHWCPELGTVKDMMKDACDEMMSEFFQCFSCFRSLCETAHESVSGGERDKNHNIIQHLGMASAGHFAQNAVCRKVSVQLGIHYDVVEFVMGDDDFKEALQAGMEGQGECECHSSWHELNRVIAANLDNAWEDVGSCKSLPFLVARIFSMEVPFMSLFNLNPFATSCQRVLMFTAEFSGSLLLAVVFFQASGDMKGKVQEDPDACEAAGFWEQIGFLIVIGTASMIFGLIPMGILGHLHSRSMIKLDFEGSDEWQAQLRSWRRKDWLLWIFGFAYMGFALFMVALFLANVHPDDGLEWLVSGVVTMTEDWVLVPLMVATWVPLLTAGTLFSAGCCTGQSRREVIERKRTGLEGLESEANVKEDDEADYDCRVAV